jgi:hypothetical protein
MIILLPTSILPREEVTLSILEHSHSFFLLLVLLLGYYYREQQQPLFTCAPGMNVIMPTAMMTMHQDPDLQAQSALTGSRGARLLEVLGHLSPEVDPNCKAIFAVASGDTDSSAGVDTKLLKVRTLVGWLVGWLID